MIIFLFFMLAYTHVLFCVQEACQLVSYNEAKHQQQLIGLMVQCDTYKWVFNSGYDQPDFHKRRNCSLNYMNEAQKKYVITIAEDKAETVLGMVTFAAHSPHTDDGYISVLLVDEQARNHGIGTALLNHAIAQLKSQGVSSNIMLHTNNSNNRAKKLYQKLGFVMHNKNAFPREGIKMYYVINDSNLHSRFIILGVFIGISTLVLGIAYYKDKRKNKEDARKKIDDSDNDVKESSLNVTYLDF